MGKALEVNPSLAREYPGFICGYIIVRDVKVQPRMEGLERTKEALLSELRSSSRAVPVTSIPEVVIYRNFFKAMGVDPSRLRPPVEYLLRRALGERFPSINNLVDICLLATVKHWVAVGVYDIDKVRGKALVTTAKGYETIETIDGRRLSPVRGEVIMRDDEKVVAAYTVGDAKATMVMPETRNALICVWNAPGIERKKVEEALNNLTNLIKEYVGGKVEVAEIHQP